MCPAETQRCWAGKTSLSGVADNTEREMLPLQEEEMGHLGQVHEAAGSAPLAKLGPARVEIRGLQILSIPSQTTGNPSQDPPGLGPDEVLPLVLVFPQHPQRDQCTRHTELEMGSEHPHYSVVLTVSSLDRTIHHAGLSQPLCKLTNWFLGHC